MFRRRLRSMGFRSESVWGSFGVRSGSVRGPLGVRSGSVRGAYRYYGVYSGSVWGSFGVRLGSVQAEFNPCRAIYSNSAEIYTNGRKITRIAPIWTKNCQNRSQRPKLSFEKVFRTVRLQKTCFQQNVRASRGLNKVP